MRISVELLNGEVLALEVTPEMTIRELKELMKERRAWEDEVSRATTVVELIVGDKKATNDATVEELGLSEDSKLSAVFRPNVVQCSNKWGLGPDLDPEDLIVVKIPDSETDIADYAFDGCELVAKVIIPRSVTHIGEGAFSGCSSLVSVNIPDSVTQIGDDAFSACGSLTGVNIPDSVTHIGTCAFSHCPSLVSLTIPDSVTCIGYYAFAACGQLTLTLPERLLRPEVAEGCKAMVVMKYGRDQGE